MLINIQEIDGPAKSSKGKWQEIALTYTENDDSTNRTRTLVSFGDGKAAFDQLANGEFGPGDTVDVTLKKNGKYWNWISFNAASTSKSSEGAAAAKPAASGATTKAGGWETPEERYKRNLTICRQNALTNSVNLHANIGAEISVVTVLEVAQTFFDWTTQNMVNEEDVSEQLFK